MREVRLSAKELRALMGQADAQAKPRKTPAIAPETAQRREKPVNRQGDTHRLTRGLQGKFGANCPAVGSYARCVRQGPFWQIDSGDGLAEYRFYMSAADFSIFYEEVTAK